MDPEKLAELEGAATAAAKAAEDAGGTDESLNTKAEEAKTAFETAQSSSQDPVKAELEREQRKAPKSEAEKAAFSLKKNAERARELGLNPEEVLGIKPSVTTDDEDDKPVTVKMLRERDAQAAQRTAVQLAEDIEDGSERGLTKHYLQNRIVPSGNPQEDLRLARSLVNSVKNGQIAKELERKPNGQSYSTASGGPGKRAEGEFKPTEQEANMMAQFGLTKKHILDAREKQAAAGQ